MAWRDVTVFISSTFRDMHAERDYLVKEIFPELSDWCAARQLRLTDIDLRWGVTAEDARARSVVAACLHNIDDCRPFFLCLIGQRRGWVPTKEEIAAATYEEYPTLSRRVGRMSITEMEIEHALLAPLHRIVNGLGTIPEIAQRSLFCLRNEGCVKNLPQDARAVYYDDDPAEYDALLNLRRTVNDILSPPINYSCRYGGNPQVGIRHAQDISHDEVHQVDVYISPEYRNQNYPGGKNPGVHYADGCVVLNPGESRDKTD